MAQLDRRSFLRYAASGAALPFLSCASQGPSATKQPNFLFITADDMNYDAPGVTGCPVPDITPNIDRLAGEGIRFVHAHVTIAVCQPSRSVLLTGRYPHRNGALGFDPIALDTPTLTEALRGAGYYSGILSKVEHLKPQDKFCWDMVHGQMDLGVGREPGLYYKHATQFFADAKAAGKPFFLMANSDDPHRPYAGSVNDARVRERIDYAHPSRTYKPEEIDVPGFLPDLPDIRTEIAQYYSSVRRCDDTVGMVLKALRESGMEDNTMVVFLSDNGIAVPFAKTNVYLSSTRTPWIVRWPGRVKPGQVDNGHFISGIDFMPTVLDAAGVKPLGPMDGASYLPLLEGKKQPERDHVLTVFYRTVARKDYPMRCYQNRKYGYLFNPWHDGETAFRNESMSGLTFRAMLKGAETDPQVAARVELFVHRVTEEFYDFENDPDALDNLVDSPAHQEELRRMRLALLAELEAVEDPLTGTLREHIASLKQ